MVYLDAANRKIKEPIDYLIEISKQSRKWGMILKLAGYPGLAHEADVLNAKIVQNLSEIPLEEWEGIRHPGRVLISVVSNDEVLDRTTEWLFSQFKARTMGVYKFGDNPDTDWWIERIGYLRTDRGKIELFQKIKDLKTGPYARGIPDLTCRREVPLRKMGDESR